MNPTPAADNAPLATESRGQKPRSWVKDGLRLVVFLGIGFFFIYWFLLKLEPTQKEAIWQAFRGADYAWVAALVVCSLLSHLVRALRWQLLFRPIGYRPRLNSTFGSVVVAYMANLAFPRAGEVMRCATLRTSEGIPVEKSLGTVVTERLIDAIAFGLIVAFGLVAMFGQAKDWLYDTLSQKYDNLPNMATLVLLAVGGLGVAFAAYKLLWKRMMHLKLVRRADELVRSMAGGVKSIFHLGRRQTALFLAYSALIYLLYILGGWLIFHAFDETGWLGLRAAFVVYLFGSVGMTFSQGGIGVYPVLVQLALDIYGISMETGTACGWLLWAAQQALVLVVGAGYLLYFSLTKRKRKTQ
ncbi:MAG: flippase-like domain-containing protein [Bacteroidales bacterium]|nr:flippase-like domain-containing protein [Bacteroidales bacterium]